jgi:hypothetical protein
LEKWLLADSVLYFSVGRIGKLMEPRAGEQFIEQHFGGINIASVSQNSEDGMRTQPFSPIIDSRRSWRRRRPGSDRRIVRSHFIPQKGFDCAENLRVAAAAILQKLIALAERQINRRVKQFVDGFPEVVIVRCRVSEQVRLQRPESCKCERRT